MSEYSAAESASSTASSSRKRKQNDGSAEHESDDAKRHISSPRTRKQTNMVATAKRSHISHQVEDDGVARSPDVLQSPGSNDRRQLTEDQGAGAEQTSQVAESQLQRDRDEERVHNSPPTYKPLEEQQHLLAAGPSTPLAKIPSTSSVPSLVSNLSTLTLTSNPPTPTYSQYLGSPPDTWNNETQEQIIQHLEGTEDSAAPLQDPEQQQVIEGQIATAGNVADIHEQDAQPPSYEEITVTLSYILEPERVTEREAWLQRQSADDRHTHIYGKLFVNSARELYFVQFDIDIGTTRIAWLVDDDQQRLRVDEDAYRTALKNPLLDGHLFYQRCDGALRVADLHLDLQSASKELVETTRR